MPELNNWKRYQELSRMEVLALYDLIPFGLVAFLIQSKYNFPLHNGFLGTEKIFQKVELLVSMGSLTLNLVNPAQNKCKKRKKSRELDEI